LQDLNKKKRRKVPESEFKEGPEGLKCASFAFFCDFKPTDTTLALMHQAAVIAGIPVMTGP
jgi:hypothetical protein